MTLTTAQFPTGRSPAADPGPRLPRISYYRNACTLVGGVAGELEIRQPHAVDQDLIGPDVRGGLEPLTAGAGHEVVLVHPVAAHPESAHQDSVPVQTRASRE